MNNIKTVTRYTFLEHLFPFFKDKNVSNMPKNYFLRLINLLIGYAFLAYFYYIFMNGIGKIFLGNPGGDAAYFAFFGVM